MTDNCWTCGVRDCPGPCDPSPDEDQEILALQQRINELVCEINSAEAQIESLQLTILQRQFAKEAAP